MVVPGILRLCPFLIGADSSYIVLGGSMKPTLCPGDLAFTLKADPSEVQVGDVIASRTASGVCMHRVMEKVETDEEVLFRLKGDANEDPDSSYVGGQEIIGKLYFCLPMGCLYAESGYVLAVATPFTLLTVHQAVRTYRTYDRKNKRRRGLEAILLGNDGRRRRRKIPIIDTNSVLLLVILVAGSTHMMAPYFATGGRSFFTDTESSTVTIGAATWKVESMITCIIHPNPNINIGEDIRVSGSINPSHGGVNVTLTYRAGPSTVVRLVVTDPGGSYTDTFTPTIPGTWTVQASWEGSNNYYGATSDEVQVSVLDASE